MQHILIFQIKLKGFGHPQKT